MPFGFWKRLLTLLHRGKMEPASPPSEPAPPPAEEAEGEKPTAPLPLSTPEPTDETSTPATPLLYPPQFRVGVAQSRGRVRANNEDALLAWTLTAAGGERSVLGGLFIVADGMGGHLHGERASQAALYTFAYALHRHFFLPWLQNWEQPPPEALPNLEAALEQANQAVQVMAAGGGTTLTAALVWKERLVLIHVGDSRAYLLTPKGELRRISKDHSVVARLVEQGDLSAEEAAHHPQRNMLYQALGQPTPLNPHVHLDTLPPGGTLLLCSDGLWDEIPEARLAALLQAYRQDPIEAAQRLMAEAEMAGGHDNISVVVVYRLPMHPADLTAASRPSA